MASEGGSLNRDMPIGQDTSDQAPVAAGSVAASQAVCQPQPSSAAHNEAVTMQIEGQNATSRVQLATGGNKHGDAASGEQPPAEAGITVQLRQQIADLTAKLAASEQKLTQLKEERESQFLINPSLGARPENEERVAQLVNDVKPHWEAISKEEAATVLKSWVPTFPGPHPVADTTFELSPPGVMVGWECATGKVKIVPPGPGRLVGFMPGMFPFCSLDTILSSPLLLYRMCCLFPIKLETDADSWKSVWTIYLRHKPTGAIAECFDAKGAGHMRLYAKTPDTPPVPPMFLDMMMTNRLPLLPIFNSPEHAQLKQAQEDFAKLVATLYTPDMPHPYGMVAGSMA